MELPAAFYANIEVVEYSIDWTAETPGPLGILGLELLAGVDGRFVQGEEGELTGYQGVALYWDNYWLRAEAQVPLNVSVGSVGFRFALSTGFSW